MKKLLFTVMLCIAALFSGNAYAQLGVNAGYLNTAQNVDYKTTIAGIDIMHSQDMSYNGFYFGVDYNINLTGGLGVALGLNFQYYTTSADVDVENGEFFGTYSTPIPIVLECENHAKYMALEIPVLFNYSYNITPDIKVMGYVGPAFGFGVKGEMWSEIEGCMYAGFPSFEKESEKVDAYKVYEGAENSYLNRFDVSLAFGAAISWKCVRLNVGYQCGLNNKTSMDNTTIKNNTLRVGLGYVF